MSFLTNSLSGQVGIQTSQSFAKKFQIPSQTNLLMIVQTPRGRLDKIMTVTPVNQYAQLGRRAGNPYLLAIDDVFAERASNLSVLRIADIDETEAQHILYNNTIKYDGKHNHDN